MAITGLPSDLRATTISEKVLLGFTNNELNEIFRDSPAGPIPDGNMKGTVLAWPGTRLAKLLASLVYLIAWQGKVVSRRESLLRNKITPLRLRLIKAKLSQLGFICFPLQCFFCERIIGFGCLSQFTYISALPCDSKARSGRSIPATSSAASRSSA